MRRPVEGLTPRLRSCVKARASLSSSLRFKNLIEIYVDPMMASMMATLSRRMPWSPAAAALVRGSRREAHGRAEQWRILPRVQQPPTPSPTTATRRKSMQQRTMQQRTLTDAEAESTVVSISAATSDTLGRTAIAWGDGHTSVFLNAWLRDHCRSPASINQATGQRSLDSLEDLASPAALALSGAVVRAGTADAASSVEITLEASGFKSHVCVFPAAWLRSHCPAEPSRLAQGRRAAAAVAGTLWDAGSLIPAASTPPRSAASDGDVDGPSLQQIVQCAPAAAWGPVTPHAALALAPARPRAHLREHGVAFVSGVRQLRHHFGPFFAHFSASFHPARAVCHILLDPC